MQTKAKVTLLSYTPMPEKTVACAAKLCYSPSSIENIQDGLNEEKTSSFVNMLTDIGHFSPIEHANFTFGIEGVSRSFLAEMTRHRIASFSVKSQRYVVEGNFSYIIPPEIEAIPEAKEEFLKAMEEDANAFCERAKKYELLLVPGDDFGCPGYVRISYCVTTEQIERALPAFEKLAKEYK